MAATNPNMAATNPNMAATKPNMEATNPSDACQMPNKEASANIHREPKNIDVRLTEISVFDDSFTYLKERFQEEMKSMDEEMQRFTNTLKSIYGMEQPAAVAFTAATPATWETLAKSPLIHGDGDEKTLKLRFDLSAFDPNDVKVEVKDNFLIVSAQHEETAEGMKLHRDFRQEFLLPRDTKPDTIVSSFSRDGVLTVQARLPVLGEQKPADSVLLQGTTPILDQEANLKIQSALKVQSSVIEPKVAPSVPQDPTLGPKIMLTASPTESDAEVPPKNSQLLSKSVSKQPVKTKGSKKTL